MRNIQTSRTWLFHGRKEECKDHDPFPRTDGHKCQESWSVASSTLKLGKLRHRATEGPTAIRASISTKFFIPKRVLLLLAPAASSLVHGGGQISHSPAPMCNSQSWACATDQARDAVATGELAFRSVLQNTFKNFPGLGHLGGSDG